MMFNPDTPIAFSDEDCLCRAALATRLAEVITEPDDDASFVIGIHGESGSGKTSLLEIVQSALGSRADVSVVRFNPWMVETGPGTLIPTFFTTMTAAFRFERRPELRRLARLLGDYGLMHDVSSISSLTSTGTGERRPAAGETPSARSAGTLRVQIDEALHEAALRMVVFIDDIDRLERPEMRAMFRLVKCIANFRRTTFVLACDPAHVAATLDGQHRDHDRSESAAFLEKVVQVPVTLTLPDNARLRDLALTAVGDACNAAGMELTSDEVERFAQCFDRALLKFVRTPRRVRRYANALAFSLPLFNREEASIVDHLCLEGLRVLVPDAYRFARDGMDDVLGSEAPDRETALTIRERFGQRLPELESGARSGVWWLLIQMFPRFDPISPDGIRGHEGDHVPNKDPRLAVDGNRERNDVGGLVAAWALPASKDLDGCRCDPQD